MKIYTQGLNDANNVDINTIWDSLAKAFREIHTKNASSLSFEELYRNAYKLVLKKQGEDLYNKVVDFEKEWLGQEVKATVSRSITNDLSDAGVAQRKEAGERFLRSLRQSWEDHQTSMGMLTDVLMYMVSTSPPHAPQSLTWLVHQGPCILQRYQTTIHLCQSHESFPRPNPALAHRKVRPQHINGPFEPCNPRSDTDGQRWGLYR